MALTHVSGRIGGAKAGARSAGPPVGVVLVLSALAIGAASFVGYVLWPRWPATPIGPDAPSLPVTISGVAFNVPPAAIRVKIQRRPGAHERLDLAFMWPSLAPPGPTVRPPAPAPGTPPAPTRPLERVFLTIAAAGDTLSPDERVKSIYPRYAANEPAAGPEGLAVLAFRDGTPYQGEDLIYDAQQSGHFLVRCTRDGPGPTPGICLFARRIETADLAARFPRDWLGDWRAVRDNIERLITQLRPR